MFIDDFTSLHFILGLSKVPSSYLEGTSDRRQTPLFKKRKVGFEYFYKHF